MWQASPPTTFPKACMVAPHWLPSRRTWSIAYDKHHLWLHIQWGLAYYHFCRPHQSLTMPIRGPSKRRYCTPVMAAKLVRRRWFAQDLLQLPVPEGIWLDTFPASRGCR